MADIEYYEDEAPVAPAPAQPSRVTTVINWMGALVSLTLIAGMAVWAWQLTIRDVTAVPVIQALEGTMRVAPENPGGAQADHQGLAVNRIAEGQEAEPAAERIVLAPPPVELEEIDISSASLPEVQPTQPPAETPTPDAASAATLALIDRLIDEETAEAPAVEQAAVEEPEANLPPVTTPEDRIGVIPISVPGVRQSPRPQGRPAGLQVASLATETATDAVPTTVATAEIDPSTLAAGTRLVQLGAFDDQETARAEWERLARTFPDFFADRSRIVQSAVSGGREFYRLRAHGFSDLSDARRFCTTLLAQGAACIPVTVR